MEQNNESAHLMELAEIVNQDEKATYKSAISKLNKVIIPICFLIFLMNSIDRGNIGFIANDYCKAIGLTYSQYGIGASLFYATCIIFQIPFNLILEQIGAPIWLGFLLVFWGFIAFCMGITSQIWQYYLLRLLLGVAESGCFPGVVYYIMSIYPKRDFPYAVSWVLASGAFAMPISAVMAAALISMDGVAGFAGWQWVFFIQGSIPILFGVIVYFLLPLNVSTASILTNQEKDVLNSATNRTTNQLNGIMNHPKELLRKINLVILNTFAMRNFWLLCITATCFLICQSTALYYSTLIINAILSNDSDTGLSSSQDNETCGSGNLGIYPILLTAIPYVFCGSTTVIVGHFSKKITYKKYFLCVTYLMSTASICLLPLLKDNLIVVMALLTTFVVGVSSGAPLVLSLLASSLKKEEYSFGVALFNSISMSGSLIGPTLTGMLFEYLGFDCGMFFVGFFVFVAASLVIMVRENCSKNSLH